MERFWNSRRIILCVCVFLELVVCCLGQFVRTQRHGFRDSPVQQKWTKDLQMPGFRPSKDDQYVCTSYEMPADDVYIVQYEALADAGTAHHILLFGCDEVASSEKIWECGRVCNSQEQIIFAWSKNAPPLTLPKDVGFKVGSKTKIKNIVVQIQYIRKFAESDPLDNSGIRLYLTSERQKYVAGIYLLLAWRNTIPPDTPVTHMDISCRYDKKRSIFPFGYRTHAHALGKVISGYQFNGTWQQVGKGNPQWPQAFYPVDNIVEVKENDFMVARCTFNSTGRHRTTVIGATGNDEMCNFYIMFYTDASKEAEFSTCAGNNEPNIARNIPADSDKALPPNPALDMVAHGANHHASVIDKKPNIPLDEVPEGTEVSAKSPDCVEPAYLTLSLIIGALLILLVVLLIIITVLVRFYHSGTLRSVPVEVVNVSLVDNYCVVSYKTPYPGLILDVDEDEDETSMKVKLMHKIGTNS